jgi:hypothetical protein
LCIADSTFNEQFLSLFFDQTQFFLLTLGTLLVKLLFLKLALFHVERHAANNSRVVMGRLLGARLLYK